MPVSSARRIASCGTVASSVRASASRSTRIARASETGRRAFRFFGPPKRFGSIPGRSIPISSTPWGVMTEICGVLSSATSTSTSRASCLPVAQLAAEPLLASGPEDEPRRVDLRREEVDELLLGRGLRPVEDPLAPLVLHETDRRLDEVAGDRLDVAPDVADLGELRRLDLHERSVDEARDPPGDLGLPDAGRADHQDVLRRDLARDLGGELLPPPAVAQRDGDGPLRLPLPDDVPVQLGDDPARREVAKPRLARRGGAAHGRVSTEIASFV